MNLELTPEQAKYIADYIEYEYSKRASDLKFYEVILNAVQAMNGGAMDGY